jgi:hypothetical protein
MSSYLPLEALFCGVIVFLSAITGARRIILTRDGEYLRLHQAELESQTWSYIWVDWTCMPQSPRSLPEQGYFDRCLRTMSAIIRNCGFIYFYPPFEPRLWILFEITEYVLTSSGGISKTPDIEPFLQHIDEMLETDVQSILIKHGYRCSYDRDRQYLISWLELLVLLRRLHFSVEFVRDVMDKMTWFGTAKSQLFVPEGIDIMNLIAGKLDTAQSEFYLSGRVELKQFEGILVANGRMYAFTPFPQWVSSKKDPYSLKINRKTRMTGSTP